MKYLRLLMSILMMTFVSVAFVSCGGDDDDLDDGTTEEVEETYDSKLIGKWLYSYTDSYGGTNRITREFNKDGTFTINQVYTDKNGTIQDSDSGSGTWQQYGNTIYFNFYGSTYTVTYSISGNTLILYFSSGPMKFTKLN